MTNKQSKMLLKNYRKQLVDPLIRRREHLGLSQEELNKQLGLLNGMLHQWEDCSLFPEMTEMQNWFDVLGMELVISPIH